MASGLSLAVSRLFEHAALYPGLDPEDQFLAVGRDHAAIVLDVVPRGELPTAPQLEDLKQKAIFVIEGKITVDALMRHLSCATSSTPEFTLSQFADGTQLVQIGKPTGCGDLTGIWEPFTRPAPLLFHTHPDPNDPVGMRQPSLTDLRYQQEHQKPVSIIGSPDGLTYVPISALPTEEHVSGQWVNFGLEVAAGERPQLPGNQYSRFLASFSGIRFAEWGTFLPDTTLLEAAAMLEAGHGVPLACALDLPT